MRELRGRAGPAGDKAIKIEEQITQKEPKKTLPTTDNPMVNLKPNMTRKNTN